MNYLFHLYLSDRTVEGMLGNLMGDFVKGRLDDTWPVAIRRGIEQHRRIDGFARSNAVIRRSLNRMHPRYRHYRSILVDVFYDHFLAENWSEYADLPLTMFTQRVYQALETHYRILPPGLQKVAPPMIAHRWLESYRDPETIAIVLRRLADRLSRPNPLAQGIAELHRNRPELEADFAAFLPQAVAFSREQLL